MKTLTLKLPEILEAKLNTIAHKKGQSKSEIVRRALTHYISHDGISQSGSFLDLSRDLEGSIEGPSDLSANNVHFERYGK
ncbi:MAG: ribbon-helix-helix protein, CopG family [Candidatus Scalindua sp.]